VHTAEADFEPRPDCVQAARQFVRRTLDEWGAQDAEWAAGQVVSELATNAVLHARTPFTLILSLDAQDLLVRVRDGSARSPLMRHFGDEATTGRGLALVAQLSREWGVDREGRGKVVWSAIDVRSAALSGEDELDVDIDSLLEGFEDDFDAADGERAVGSAEARAAA
jgi:anti-sigma regulatory factor (Ser/Thr protein kinase)